MKNFKIKLIFSFCLVLSFNFLLAQSNLITGVVFDKKYVPLPGVTVLVEGTQNEVNCDFDGNYSINASEGEILIYSFPRLGQLRVTVEKNDSDINVNLDKKLKNQKISKKKKVIKSASNISSNANNSTRISNNTRQSNRILNNEIKYSFAKEDLKEFLAIQALLSENRMEDLKSFFIKRGYQTSNNGDKITLYKMDINNMRELNEIFPVITIQSGKYSKEWIDNSIQIMFMKVVKDDLKKGTFHSKSNAIKIQNLIKENIDIGQRYSMFKDLKNLNQEGFVFEKIDRYTSKITSENNSERIFKASNFFKLNEMLLFSGPGKTAVTQLYFDEPYGENDKYICEISIRSLKYNSPDEKSPFNLNFFMSLSNFNDRIWEDN